MLFSNESYDMTCKGHSKEHCQLEITGLKFTSGQGSWALRWVRNLELTELKEIAIVEVNG